MRGNNGYGRMNGSGQGWNLRHPSRIIPLIVILLVVGPFVAHYYLAEATNEDSAGNDRHLLLDSNDVIAELTSISCDNAKFRIQELLKIKASVSNELRDLEQHRRQLQESISVASLQIDKLKQEESHMKAELEKLKISVEQALITQKEVFERNMPQIMAPRRMTASHQDAIFLPIPNVENKSRCRMYNCFDYSRCSLLSGFPIYFYDPDQFRASSNDLDAYVKTTVRQALGYNSHLTEDPHEACVYVALVGEQLGETDVTILQDNLHSLPYWNGDGRNHVLLNLGRNAHSSDVLSDVNTGRAIIVQSFYLADRFRRDFDIVVPPILGMPGGDLWRDLPPIVPAKRQYLASFVGEWPPMRIHLNNSSTPISSPVREEVEFVEQLMRLERSNTQDKFLLHFTCQGSGGAGNSDEWQLCGSEAARAEVLHESSFGFVLATPEISQISTTAFQTRLFEALKYGAVPVIIGSHAELPFAETLDWRKLAVMVPRARLPELHFLLRSIGDADLLFLRRQGRLVWQKFLGSSQVLVDSILATLRQRLNIPPLAAAAEPSPSVFNGSFVPLKTDAVVPDPDTDENLGPMEPPFPSVVYGRNFTLALVTGYEEWNVWGDPFNLYPNLPTNPILPTEAKFSGSPFGFRPIGSGSGGSGKEFSESIGGNHPREQFTIVMLTYEREQVLLNSLSRLYGLPYLNKVIIVWNSPTPPSDTLLWPDIKVPVKIIRAERNSLNNRFLPFDEIETDAILSVDDDAHLRHDEIVFGFRVWREERDRVVGFPGRFHAWDLNHGGWLYNSNYSCELSMVLTGAAFFHKYYAYMYSNVMPQAIRDKVDEYMNCEDIAMNFLVSHINRKSPVKVTSRWTFRCPGCPVSLSEDDSHFTERHHCINFFTQVYGYNPLVNTQYRVDSVLFKTRLPHDKQKCFRFI